MIEDPWVLLIARKVVESRVCNQVGHIEDVVVDAQYRGHKLGQRLKLQMALGLIQA